MGSKLNIIIIKNLPKDRWQDYKKLRLQSLKNDPIAYGAKYEEEADLRRSFWTKDLIGKSDKKPYFVEIGGKLVGMAGAKYAKHDNFSHIAKIGAVYINKNYRRKGLGKMLLQEMVKDILQNKNIKKIKLTVNKTQKPAIVLYNSLGFKIVGTMRKEFKISGKYHDAYLMELMR